MSNKKVLLLLPLLPSVLPERLCVFPDEPCGVPLPYAECPRVLFPIDIRGDIFLEASSPELREAVIISMALCRMVCSASDRLDI